MWRQFQTGIDIFLGCLSGRIEKKEILYRKNLVNIVFYDKISDRIKALVFVSPVVSQIRKEIRWEKMKSN